MIGDTSERIDIDITRDRWVRQNNRVDVKGNYCLFWCLEWVCAYQQLHNVTKAVSSKALLWFSVKSATNSSQEICGCGCGILLLWWGSLSWLSATFSLSMPPPFFSLHFSAACVRQSVHVLLYVKFAFWGNDVTGPQNGHLRHFCRLTGTDVDAT
jgi:hypothetical protein